MGDSKSRAAQAAGTGEVGSLRHRANYEVLPGHLLEDLLWPGVVEVELYGPCCIVSNCRGEQIVPPTGEPGRC